ncbi:MAG: Na+/H+ antiporter subunit E [Alphaproteobacteria bacterium]
MINAAAMLAGLFALWLLLTPRFQGAEALVIAAGAAFAAVLLAARLGAVGGRGGFGAAPMFVGLKFQRIGAMAAGALATIQAALGVKSAIKPALVLVKTRPTSQLARAAFSDLISAAPGSVVIESNEGSLLVHALDEERVDGAALSELEARVIRAIDGKGAL